jgi:hypothetical protein
LLDEGRNRRAPSPPPRNRQHTDQQPLTEGYGPDGAALVHKEGQGDYGAGYPVAKTRWYRTRWGITAIVIIIIIIIAAITGGAVGATHHSNHKNNANGGVGTLGGSSSSASKGGNPNTPNTVSGGNPVGGGPNTVFDATAGIETGTGAIPTAISTSTRPVVTGRRRAPTTAI